jgi:hypothetical protein
MFTQVHSHLIQPKVTTLIPNYTPFQTSTSAQCPSSMSAVTLKADMKWTFRDVRIEP